MQSQFQKGWKGFNFSGFVKFRVFSCIARKAKVWECSAPDDTDTTAIKVAIDDVILHHVESFIIGQNYKAKILEEELNHLQIAISSPLNRILKYGISQAKDNSSVDVVGTFWSKLCLHNEKIGFCSVCNFHFAGQQGNCNRCSPSLYSRNSDRISLVFQARGKITSLKRARKRLLYAGFAILHSCQLHCPIDVKNGNGSSNAFPGWKLQFFLFSSRHLCCSTDEELGQQNAVINQKAPKNLLYKSQVRKKKKIWVFTIVFLYLSNFKAPNYKMPPPHSTF